MVNIKIHRGTSQIGGTITEIYTENSHIFIDFGSELTLNSDDSTDGKMIDMINNTACDAVLFSHYHGDHVGLLEHIPSKDIQGKEIILGMGKVARQVLVNIQKSLANDMSSPSEERQAHKELLNLLKDNSRWIDFSDILTVEKEQSTTFTIGDFHITTIRVDHSAYDSYMFLIENNSKKILYTGDYSLEETVLTSSCVIPENLKVDILIMCGLHAKHSDYVKKTGDTAKTVIASTASPFKFGRSVLNAIDSTYDSLEDMEQIEVLSKVANVAVPKAIEEIKNAPVRHDHVCEKDQMVEEIKKFLQI